MTTPEIQPAVVEAIAEIRASFERNAVDAEPDGSGGAHVTVHALHLGEGYEPSTSWVSFHITFQYPYADVYPHYLVAGLKRACGAALQVPFHSDGQTWKTPTVSRPATMLSRRSNRWDPGVDTACDKLLKVLHWIRSQ
jgi:hypothetical protein